MGTSDSMWSGFALPLAFGAANPPVCFIFASPDATVAIPAAGGVASLAFNVPNTPSLVGSKWFSQFGAPDGPDVVFTNATRILFGQ